MTISAAPKKLSVERRSRILGTLRRICMSLPDVTERVSHGEPTFFHRDKRAFAMMDTYHHGSDHYGVWCAAPTGAQAALVKADPDRFFVPPYVGARGWLGVRLDRKLDWGEVEGIVRDAYHEVSARRR